MPTTHRFLALFGLTAAIAAAAAPNAAQAKAAPKPAGPTLKIESKTCNVGTAADARNVVLTASAVLRDAGEEVQMRFTVQQRPTVKSSWRSVFAKVGDLGTWATSEPGADGLRYTKTINGLAEGMQYRVLVDARAVNAAGKIVTKTSRRTSTCVQPQLSSHVIVQSVKQPATPATGPILKVAIRNTGKAASAAPVVTVRDAATQAVLGQLTADPLDGKASTTVTLEVSQCDATVNITVQETGAALTDVTPDQTLSYKCLTGGEPEGTKASRSRR